MATEPSEQPCGRDRARVAPVGHHRDIASVGAGEVSSCPTRANRRCPSVRRCAAVGRRARRRGRGAWPHTWRRATGALADTIWRANPREQGLLGLTDAIGWFGRQGWSVSLPLIDSQPYDLIVDDGTRLQRVQVKTTTYRSRYGVFVVSLATRGGNQSFHTSKDFDPASCELLFVLTDDEQRYLIPTSKLRGRTTTNLGEHYEAYRLRG